MAFFSVFLEILQRRDAALWLQIKADMKPIRGFSKGGGV